MAIVFEKKEFKIRNGILVVLVGPPGSGKTYTRDLVESTLTNFDHVCPDEIRKELYGDESEQGDPKEVFKIAHKRTKEMLKTTNVIFDATNCKREYREAVVLCAKGSAAHSVVAVSQATAEECLEANAKRDRKVPAAVISRMVSDLRREPPLPKAEGFDCLVRLELLLDYLLTLNDGASLMAVTQPCGKQE